MPELRRRSQLRLPELLRMIATDLPKVSSATLNLFLAVYIARLSGNAAKRRRLWLHEKIKSAAPLQKVSHNPFLFRLSCRIFRRSTIKPAHCRNVLFPVRFCSGCFSGCLRGAVFLPVLR